MPRSAGQRSNQFLISIYYYYYCCCWVFFHTGSVFISHQFLLYCLFAVRFAFVVYVFIIRVQYSTLLPYRRVVGTSGVGCGALEEMRWHERLFGVPISWRPIGSVPWSLQLWPASGHKNLLFEFYCFQSYLHTYIFSLVFSFRCILYKSRRRLPYGDIGRGWLAAVFVDVCCLFKVSEDVHWLGDSDIIIEMDDHWPLANQKIWNPSYLHSPVILSPINRPSTCHNSLIRRSPLLRCCSNCIPWHRSNSKTIRTYKHTTDFGSANFGARRWMCNLRCQLGCRSSRGCGSWKWCDSVTLRSDLQVERARKPIGGCHCLLGGQIASAALTAICHDLFIFSGVMIRERELWDRAMNATTSLFAHKG